MASGTEDDDHDECYTSIFDDVIHANVILVYLTIRKEGRTRYIQLVPEFNLMDI